MSEEWPTSDERGLARHVTPDAIQRLPTPFDRLSLVQQKNGLHQLAQKIYDDLCKQDIYYDLEDFSPGETTQKIRTPEEIVRLRRGTCLDLAVFFCGLCLGYRLLPLLIVFDDHAIAAVSLTHDLDSALNASRPLKYAFQRGLLTDLAKMRDLINSQTYMFIECTGFAQSKTLSGPEGNGRNDRGLLSFNRAEAAGKEHFDPPHRRFRFALDVAVLQIQEGYTPIRKTNAEIVAVYENVLPRPVDQEKLAAARQKLSELPLETSPGVASSGYGWKMPFVRNDSFVGREADLHRLAALLKERERAVAIVTGPGGMGKTQLASEFVHRYGQYFAGVFWLSFADANDVPAKIIDCRTALGGELRPDVRTLPPDEQVQLVLATWQNGLPRLLIFDNCEEEVLFARWQPPTGDCRILVTSWRARWDVELGVKMLPLNILHPEESLALLRNHLLNFSPAEIDALVDDLNAVADELGHLPLALHLAGHFLNRYGKTSDPPRVYLTQLRQVTPLQHSSLQCEGKTYSTGHIRHVERTFALSYERLHPSDPRDVQALRLLARAAHFAPGEPIPSDLLLSTMGQGAEDQEAKRQFTDALERLIAFGLLEEIQEKGMLRLHGLLAEFVRLRSGSIDTEAQTAVEQVLVRIADYLNGAGNLAPMLTLQPHLRFVTDQALQRKDELAAVLCQVLTAHLYLTGAYTEALRYAEQTLAICEKVLGPDHPRTATGLNNLAQTYRAQGQYDKAEPLYQRAVALYEKLLGPEHPDTATGLNNLAGLYEDQGQYDKARPLYQRAVAIREKVLGPDHRDTARDLNNLAGLYLAQGQYDKAEPLYERALTIDEKVSGPEHRDMATSLNNLAGLYRAQGQYDKAEPLYQRVLAINEKALGPEHPDMAKGLNNLAGLYRAQGQYDKAEPLYQRAVAIHEKLLGPEHPDTATGLNNLAGLYEDQGQYDKARPLYQRAVAIREKVLGPDHPRTATSLNNLAMLYQSQGEYEQAEPLYERALAILEQALGPKHPNLAISLNNLGMLYQSRGKYEQAKPLYQRAIAIDEQALGPEHPGLATDLSNLAMLYQSQREYEQAEPLYQRALAIYEKALGPEHPDMAKSLNNLGYTYGKQGKYGQAKPLLQRALTIYKQVLGPEHPDTVATSKNYTALLQMMNGEQEGVKQIDSSEANDLDNMMAAPSLGSLQSFEVTPQGQIRQLLGKAVNTSAQSIPIGGSAYVGFEKPLPASPETMISQGERRPTPGVRGVSPTKKPRIQNPDRRNKGKNKMAKQSRKKNRRRK